MANEAARVMFEIYRESGYAQKYRAVYFTELDENNKEKEISRAMAGEHIYDSFLSEKKLSEGKTAVAGVIERLNGGEALAPNDIEAALAPYEA